MSGSNFTNGSLVMRIWRFDGSGDVLGKFQYFPDALRFAEAKSREETTEGIFYLAVCDHENTFKSFFPAKFEGVPAPLTRSGQ